MIIIKKKAYLMQQNLDVTALLKSSYKLYLQHAALMIPASLTVSLAGLLQSSFSRVWHSTLAFMLMAVFILPVLKVGLANYTLKIVRGEPVGYANLFDGIDVAGSAILKNMMTFVIAFVGMIALLIPGGIFLIKSCVSDFVLMDKKQGAYASIKTSWELTGSYEFFIVKYAISVALLMIPLYPLAVGMSQSAHHSWASDLIKIGLLPYALGVVLVVPILNLAMAQIYAHMVGQGSAGQAE